MAKKLNPQYEAIRAAKAIPEKRFHISKRMSWAKGQWPTRWMYFTNWTSLTLDIGENKKSQHGSTVPTAQFVFRFATRPFSTICFWGNERLFWFGDQTWKKALRKG